MNTWYEKIGRKYVPVASTFCKFLIKPDRANLLAAIVENEDRMREVIRNWKGE